MTRFRFDFDAALWFAVALVASAFATLPVLAAGLALLGRPLDGWYYIGATGAVTVLAFGVATALLVRARPWRTVPNTLLTLYLLQLGAASFLLVGQFIRWPSNPLPVLMQLLAPLTFGLLQVDGFVPLKFAFPDAWPLLGTLAGLGIGRWMLAARGKPAGAAARVDVQPMRLPKL